MRKSLAGPLARRSFRDGVSAISGGMLLMMALSASGACSGANRGDRSADRIFLNAAISSPGAAASINAIAISRGAIAAVGSPAEVEALRGPGTRVSDLQGKVLLPGLVDHHIHLMNVGFSLLNSQTGGKLFLDLSSATSLEEIARRVQERAAVAGPGAWLLGKGWSQIAWGSQQLPTHDVLSSAAPDNPVFLARVDGHAGWVNRSALLAAGIGRQTADPAGGTIARLANGEPSGVLLERANEMVLGHVPPPSDEQVKQAFRLAAEAMAAQGIVEIFDAGFLAEPGIVAMNADLERYLDLLLKADAEQPLPLRINLMIPAPSPLAEKVVADPESFRRLSPRVAVTHIKLFCDGAFGSRGAWLTHPYLDDPSTQGVRRMTDEELRAAVRSSLRAGFDVAVHAIGDAAVRQALDAFESELRERPELNPGRLRIEHFSYALAEDIRRAAALKVVLCIQPNFIDPDAKGRTMEDSRIGSENCKRAYPWGTLARLGARLADSSDYFTAPAHPLLNFYVALSRMNTSGRPAAGWHPEERLSREDAYRLLTGRCAAGGAEPEMRTLEIGAPADLTVVSADPMQAGIHEILETKVHATVLEGRITFSDGTLRDLSLPDAPAPH